MSFEKKNPKNNNFIFDILFIHFVDSFFANDEQSLTKNKVVVRSLTQYS